MTIVTKAVEDVAGNPDFTVWRFGSDLSLASDDVTIKSSRVVSVIPDSVDGEAVVWVDLDPGTVGVEYRGITTIIEVPDSDEPQDLLELLDAGSFLAGGEGFTPSAAYRGSPVDLVEGSANGLEAEFSVLGNLVGSVAMPSSAVGSIAGSGTTGVEILEAETAAEARAAIAVPEVLPAAFYSATDKADAALADTGFLDSGQRYVATSTNPVGWDIVDGGLQTDETLAYLNFGPLPGEIRRFDMDVKWTDDGYGDDQTAVIIVSDGPFAEGFPGSTDYANAGAHILLGRDVISWQKRQGDGMDTTTMLTHWFEDPLEFGVVHRFKMTWDGSTARMVTPDGAQLELAPDTQQSLWWGEYGCAEIVNNGTPDNNVQIMSFSATSDPAVGTPELDPYRVLGAGVSNETTSSTALTTTLSASLWDVSFTIPESKRVWVEGAAFCDHTVQQTLTASQLLIGAFVAGVTSHGHLTTCFSGYAPANASVDDALFADRQGSQSTYSNGMLIPFAFDLTLSDSFAVGSVQTMHLRMQANASGLWSYIHSGGSGGASGIRRSFMKVSALPESS